MDLPVMPPLKPMLAKPAARIPTGLHYEAKWDGFRALVFRDGEEVELTSRTTHSLTRYFPELSDALRSALPNRCVVDGEIIVVRGDHLDFEALLERVHPAESRVRHLAEETPASFVAFDLLALEDTALLELPFSKRRRQLESVLTGVHGRVRLASVTDQVEVAQEWFDRFEGAGLDGVVAKRPELPYRPDQRLMFKVKHERTADCVVAGLREHKSGPVVGSLLLGLYDSRGVLQHVGVCASFPMRRREELMRELAPLRMESVASHPWAAWQDEAAHADSRMPGGPSRWTGKKDLSWVPLRPERVCEVSYDHMQGDRFRHTAQFKRWRPDRDPDDCGYAQLEEPVRYDLNEVLGGPPAS